MGSTQLDGIATGILMTLRILGGRFRHRHLISPKGLTVRPSTGRLREALFNICQHEIEGANFLDLFAGSGAMGLEALSRGAKHATFIESDRTASSMIRDNLKSLMLESEATVFQGDVLRFLERFGVEGRQFSLIFADPPYAKQQEGLSLSHQLLKIVDENKLIIAGGRLFIEEAAEAAPPTDRLKHLQLKDVRRYGRSVLQQWIVREVSDESAALREF